MADNAVRVEMICSEFNQMLAELAAIDPKIEFRDVCVGIAARVVYGALSKTKAATAPGIKKDFETKEFTTFNGKKYKLTNRFPDAIWAGIDQRRKDRLAVKLGARGLSKQSFYWLGQLLGMDRAVPGYVSAANYKGRVYQDDANTSEAGSGNDFALTILNSSPIVQAAGGRNALLNAMRGETRYFEMNMKNGFYRTLESRVQKYPQIFISKS